MGKGERVRERGKGKGKGVIRGGIRWVVTTLMNYIKQMAGEQGSKEAVVAAVPYKVDGSQTVSGDTFKVTAQK